MADNRPHLGTGDFLSADLIAQRGFATARRGYDVKEVQDFLGRVAAEVREMRQRIEETEAARRQAEERARHPRIDEETLLGAVGEETASILRTARSAANEIRSKAEERATSLLREAHAQADALRAEAEALMGRRTAEAEAAAEAVRVSATAEAERVRSAARQEAEAVRQQADQERRLTIEAAQTIREKILSDLARRRRVASVQIEQLRAGRERLLDAYLVVRRTLDEVTDELQRADAEARAASEAVAQRAAAEAPAGDTVPEDLAALAAVAPAETVDPVPAAGPTGPAGPAGDQPPGDQPPGAQRPGAPSAGAPSAGAPSAGAPSAGAPSAGAKRPGDQPAPATASAEPSGVSGQVRPRGASPAADLPTAQTPAVREPAPVARPEAELPTGQTPAVRGGTGPEAPGTGPREQSQGRDPDTAPTDVVPSAPQESPPAPEARGASESVRILRGASVTTTPRSGRSRSSSRRNGPKGAPAAPAKRQAAAPESSKSTPGSSKAAPGSPDSGGTTSRHESGAAAGEPEADPGDPEEAPGVATTPSATRAEEPAVEVEEAPAEDQTGEAGAAQVATTEPPATEAPAGEAPAGEGDDVGGLFARIRADRAKAVTEARETLAGAPGGDQPEAAGPAGGGETPTPAPAPEQAAVPDSGQAAVPDSGEAVVPDSDEAYLQRRDEALADIELTLARRLKRTLQDEQNHLLDRLRGVKGTPRAGSLLPRLDDQRAHVVDAGRPLLEQAARAGVAFGQAMDGAGAGSAVAAPSIEDLAEEMGDLIARPLRRRLEQAFSDTAGDDQQVLVEALGSAYREWKTQRIELIAGDAVAGAFSRGSFEAVADGTPLRWLVDDDDGPCPDCDDNALAGSLPKGELFPTGQPYPPAHAGCRCLLVSGSDG